MVDKLTRNGIAYNLEISPYKLTVTYEDETLEFIFSSLRYKEIFLSKQQDNRDYINSSLSKRFKMDLEFNKLADIKLYADTEKRGFLIIGEDKHTWLSTIKLSGATLTFKNSEEQ